MEMCRNCMHKDYCPSAYKKDTWCGNHITREDFEKYQYLIANRKKN